MAKKKKRSKPAVADTTHAKNPKVIIDALLEAFSLASIHEATAAYKEADGDVNKAALILAAGSFENVSSSSSWSSYVADDSSSMSSGSGSYGMDSSSTSSEGFKDLMLFRGKAKKLVASTGMVSTVLGKDYVTTNCKKSGGSVGDPNGKGFNGKKAVVDREEAEQFLCSMLGDEPGLNLAVVRDVLCCCAYDVEKALDALLRMCGTADVQPYENSSNRSVTDDEFYSGLSSYASSQPSEKEDHYINRSYVSVVASSDSDFPREKSTVEVLPQAVLDSLFKVPKSPGRDPHTMNWRNVVKKLESIRELSEDSEVQTKEPGKGNEYQFYRKSASEYWESTRSYYQKAASAYSAGERSYAAYLSDQGKLQTKIARKADEKASQQIFKARNKNIGNVITIDLHGQHVKQAMKFLKLHLLFGSYACSIQSIRVITGSGIHGLGKSMIKQSVIKLMERENIQWVEENSGTVVIRLNGQRNFSFVDTDSDEPEE